VAQRLWIISVGHDHSSWTNKLLHSILPGRPEEGFRQAQIKPRVYIVREIGGKVDDEGEGDTSDLYMDKGEGEDTTDKSGLSSFHTVSS
jgi:hypothetical protein